MTTESKFSGKIGWNQFSKKRIAMGVGAIVAGVGLLYATNSVSYLTTLTNSIQESVKENVPIEYELERARTMIADLIPEIQKNLKVVAQEEVEVESIRAEITESDLRLDDDRERLLTLRSDLDNKSGQFKIGDREATGDEIRAELRRRFNLYQTADATLQAKNQILSEREKSLAAARAMLASIVVAKEDLEVQVENLVTRLRILETKRNRSDSQLEFDDSQLAHCKQIVEDVRLRLVVAERLVSQEGQPVEFFAISPETGPSIEHQIDDHFNSSTNPVSYQRKP